MKKLIALAAFILFALSLIFMMMLSGGTTIDDCLSFVGGRAASGTATGDWKDKNSQAYKNMEQAAKTFKAAGYSGNNIAAILAVGYRESNFDPKASNPNGQVKGIFQWGAGKINGNRYGDTPETVTAQLQLALKELNTSKSTTKDNLLKAHSISDSFDVWDTQFEGVGEDDPQRKIDQTLANAQGIKELFKLDFVANKDASPLQEVATGTIGSNTEQTALDAGLANCAVPNTVTGTASGAATQQMPAKYKGKVDFPDNRSMTFSDNKYPFGQCTWYVYNRIKQVGKNIDWFSGDLGNGAGWPKAAKQAGYTVEENTPHVGWAVSFQGGQYDSVAPYGHIAFVEYVNDDGSFLVSEANVVSPGTGTVSYREFPSGKGLAFIEPK